MSRQRPSHVVQYSRAILYEDKVIRKTAKFQADEEIVLTAVKVTRKLSSGKDSTCVELSGCKEKSSKQKSIAKFHINLSGHHWSHHVDEQSLRFTISTTNAATGCREECYVFKMKSREQLAAWAAEIIQASTYQTEHTLQRCFHVIVPTYKGGLIRASNYQKHAVLKASHPNDNLLVARDPLSLTELRHWDLSELETYSFDFFPDLRLCLLIKPRDETYLPSGHPDYIFFLSEEVLQQVIPFMESFFETRLPKLYGAMKKRMFQRQSLHGTLSTGMSFDINTLKPASANVKRSLSATMADYPPPPPIDILHCPSYESVIPYASSEIVPIGDPDVSRLGSPLSQQKYKTAGKPCPAPPSDMIRPSVAATRPPFDGYVELSPLDKPLLTRKPIPVISVEPGVRCDDSDNEEYENVIELVPPISETDTRRLSSGSQHASDSDAKRYVPMDRMSPRRLSPTPAPRLSRSPPSTKIPSPVLTTGSGLGDDSDSDEYDHPIVVRPIPKPRTRLSSGTQYGRYSDPKHYVTSPGQLSPKPAAKFHPCPPSDLIRPGIPVSRLSWEPYDVSTINRVSPLIPRIPSDDSDSVDYESVVDSDDSDDSYGYLTLTAS